jgi:SIR2-like domain
MAGAKSLHELLSEWPYARDYLLDTMDPDLIEEHGRALLARALNIGNVVAFLSAGVSMAYGRISWKALVEDLVKEAQTAAKAKVEKGEKLRPSALSLRTTLKGLQPSDRRDGEGIRSDRYPSLFQLCEELIGCIEGEDYQAEIMAPTDLDKNFLKNIKMRTRDGHFHALGILVKYISLSESNFSPKKLKEEELKEKLKEARQKLHYINFLKLNQEKLNSNSRQRIFSAPDFVSFCIDYCTEKGPDPQESLINRDCVGNFLKLLGQVAPSDVDKYCRKPSLRFLFVAACALTGDLSDMKVTELYNKYIESLKPNTAPGRLIDPPSDIVGTLHKNLKIRRFLTTNYDLEVERYLSDLGFHAASAPNDRLGASISNDPLGQSCRDFVVTNERAAILADFALQDTRYQIDVAHLHGRSLPGEPIVASEGSYQKFYLHDDNYRPMLDQAIELAFRSNTLLFVGSGMGEDDILRPLRQFMSQDTGARPPPAIALLPDLHGKAGRIEEKISLLRRYGVYAVHWGRGRTKLHPDQACARRSDDYILPAVKQLIGAISAVISACFDADARQFKPNPFGGHKGLQVLARWKDAIKTAKSCYLVPDVEEKKLVLADLFSIEGIELDHREGDFHPEQMILIEWKALRFAFEVALGLKEKRSEPGSVEHVGRVHAAYIVVQEIEDSLLSAFLAAAVHSLDSDWQDWKDNWFPIYRPRRSVSSPRPIVQSIRESRPDVPPAEPERLVKLLKLTKLEIERRFCTPDLVGDGSRNSRFRPRYSQTFADFAEALRHQESLPRVGRRIFFLAGARGLGKGHMFAAFGEAEAICDYREAASTEEELYGLFAFNFSFSVELGSGFDRLANFLKKQVERMYKDAGLPESISVDFSKRFDLFRPHGSRTTGDRVGSLRFLFEVLHGPNQPDPGSSEPLRNNGLPKPNGRIIIVLNASHLMFNRDGAAKSADVASIMAIFLSREYQSAAVDIVFITNEQAMPRETRNVTFTQSPDLARPLIGGELPMLKVQLHPLLPRNRSEIEVQEDGLSVTNLRLRLKNVSKITDRPDEHAAKNHDKNFTTAYFHRLQQPRASVIILSAFRYTAINIALRGLERSGKLQEYDHILDSWFKYVNLDLKSFWDSVYKISSANNKGHVSRQISRRKIRKLLILLIENIKKELIKHGKAPKNKIKIKCTNSMIELAEREYPISSEPEARLFEARLEEIDREFGRLYKRVGRSRICLSMACAAAEEEISFGSSWRDIMAVLEKISNSMAGFDEINREDTLIRAVMDHYRADPKSKEKKKALSKRPPLSKLKCDSELEQLNFFLLQEELLAALAMIAQPVEADCLSQLDLRALPRSCKGWQAPIREALIRKAFIEVALDQLVDRCLIFRFDPRPTPSGGREPGLARYSVHRLVQRHVFRRMHQPRVEFPEIESYMPTLYTSLPNDLPYPMPDAHKQIRGMVIRLSRYPSETHFPDADEKGEQDEAIRVDREARMLRAAYGIMRTVYSAGVVARFNAYIPATPAPADGFFEEHRLHVRWLLWRAKEIEGNLRSIDKDKPRSELGSEADDWQRDRLAFHSGDIVWLYNECGLLSMIQGNLHDAAKLFAEGLRAVQAYEAPKIGGASTNVLRLNRAIVDIEMGKCRKAEGALGAIAAAPHEHRIVRWVATGYLGLIDHVRGDTTSAEHRYQKSVDALRSLQCYRAASIFARYQATMHIANHSADSARIWQIAEDAVKLASIGNHEDVYQLARLVRLRAQVKGHRPAADQGREAAELRQTAEVQSQLENISVYARVMGMPRLSVQIAQLDAEIRVEAYDLHNAMKSVTRALSLANEKGMVLKKVELMTLLAGIYELRGMRDGARLLAESARNLAIATEYSTAQDEAQAILSRL